MHSISQAICYELIFSLVFFSAFVLLLEEMAKKLGFQVILIKKHHSPNEELGTPTHQTWKDKEVTDQFAFNHEMFEELQSFY